MRTAVGAALGGVALLVSGCAGDSQAQIDDSTSPSLGSANALVLRTMTSGGIAGLGAPGSMPDFSLYGDGRAIAGRTHPMEYHLTPPALRRLVADASKAGLATPRTVDNPNIADAMYKVITFVTGGRARTTRVIQGGGPADDAAVRFLPRLDPAGWPRGDQSAAPKPYHPKRLAVLAVASAGESSGAPWPFKPLTAGTPLGGRTCTVLTGGDVAKAEALADRPEWRYHGRTYRVTLRPLLPDEQNCAALAH
ncbi:hypothetical protein [Actinomadura sp. DC4]|uniref:hypothetical protein n=1 Tax=Actinomadura sp. DC4 TaxID=3055069 RepID=UPI0025B0CA0F|nr:hypothetical protein [Actinomadura sp. DC4]MDN3357021.1 hypothetical protein [Actinomadura sp. DC4]